MLLYCINIDNRSNEWERHIAGLCSILSSSTEGGLKDEEEINKKRAEFGANVVPPRPAKSFIALCWDALQVSYFSSSFPFFFILSFPYFSFFFFSLVLRDSTPRFVCPSVSRSVSWSVGWSVHLTFTFFMTFILWSHCTSPCGLVTSNMAPAQCPPARVWGSRVSGLVSSPSLVFFHF